MINTSNRYIWANAVTDRGKLSLYHKWQQRPKNRQLEWNISEENSPNKLRFSADQWTGCPSLVFRDGEWRTGIGMILWSSCAVIFPEGKQIHQNSSRSCQPCFMWICNMQQPQQWESTWSPTKRPNGDSLGDSLNDVSRNWKGGQGTSREGSRKCWSKCLIEED